MSRRCGNVIEQPSACFMVELFSYSPQQGALISVRWRNSGTISFHTPQECSHWRGSRPTASRRTDPDTDIRDRLSPTRTQTLALVLGFGCEGLATARRISDDKTGGAIVRRCGSDRYRISRNRQPRDQGDTAAMKAAETHRPLRSCSKLHRAISAGAGGSNSTAGARSDHAVTSVRRRRIAPPTRPKPEIINAHVTGSGTTAPVASVTDTSSSSQKDSGWKNWN